ncbi:MAG: hypothetical protein RLZZ53_1686 [Acidobacteriota bacterium]|jgi:hypothetical protein
MRRVLFNITFGSVLLIGLAVDASAQGSPASPVPPASPSSHLVVEQIQSGWLFSPDVRATDLNGTTEALAGGYIGRITDRSWVIGVGGYTLTNPDDDRKLWYGGPVFEWLIRADRKIGFGVRALVGAGSGTLALPLSNFANGRAINVRDTRRDINVRTPPRITNTAATVAVQDDFYVAEPQVNMMWNLTQGQRIVFGVGYRAIGSAPLLGDDLKGVSGSISYQLGGK